MILTLLVDHHRLLSAPQSAWHLGVAGVATVVLSETIMLSRILKHEFHDQGWIPYTGMIFFKHIANHYMYSRSVSVRLYYWLWKNHLKHDVLMRKNNIRWRSSLFNIFFDHNRFDGVSSYYCATLNRAAIWRNIWPASFILTICHFAHLEKRFSSHYQWTHTQTDFNNNP